MIKYVNGLGQIWVGVSPPAEDLTNTLWLRPNKCLPQKMELLYWDKQSTAWRELCSPSGCPCTQDGYVLYADVSNGVQVNPTMTEYTLGLVNSAAKLLAIIREYSNADSVEIELQYELDKATRTIPIQTIQSSVHNTELIYELLFTEITEELDIRSAKVVISDSGEYLAHESYFKIQSLEGAELTEVFEILERHSNEIALIQQQLEELPVGNVPIATPTVPGIVKPGYGLEVEKDGTLFVTAEGSGNFTFVRYSNDNGASFTGSAGQDPGSYVGFATVPEQVAPTTTNKYSWARILGETGLPGHDGKPGISIDNVINYYLISEKYVNVTAAEPGWTTTPPTPTKDKMYLWAYEIIQYSESGGQSETVPHIIGK